MGIPERDEDVGAVWWLVGDTVPLVSVIGLLEDDVVACVGALTAEVFRAFGGEAGLVAGEDAGGQ